MEILSNNQKDIVALGYFVAVNIMLSRKKDPINELIKQGQEIFGKGRNILYVGDTKKKIDKDTDYVLYARLWSGKIAKLAPGVWGNMLTGSGLILMWFDDNLKVLLSKVQKFLSQISWDKHTSNIYS